MPHAYARVTDAGTKSQAVSYSPGELGSVSTDEVPVTFYCWQRHLDLSSEPSPGPGLAQLMWHRGKMKLGTALLHSPYQ